MEFWHITFGDVIGYILTIIATTITVSTVIKINYSSHHNDKRKNKTDQSSSTVGRDQIGGDKR